MKKSGGGHGGYSINNGTHVKSDAMLNAAQQGTVVLACPLFFHKLRPVLNHLEGSVWAITSTDLIISSIQTHQTIGNGLLQPRQMIQQMSDSFTGLLVP